MARLLRVHVPKLLAGRAQLPRDQAHYVAVVHRLRAGDEFAAFDPEQGTEARARLLGVERGRVECEFDEPREAAAQAFGIHLLQAAVKGDKLEQVVRAATALGVDSVSIALCEHSVAFPHALRRERLQSVAIEAARQSGRSDVPRIDGPRALSELVSSAQAPNELRLCLSPRAERSVFEFARAWLPFSPVRLLVGPEGGLSDAELALARAAGYAQAALGPYVLRSELAALAACACFAARVPILEDRE